MKNSFRAGGFKEWLMLGSSIGLPVLVFFGWSLFAWGETAELAWRDFLYTLRGSRETPNNVVIVAVDDPSFQEIGLKWPWPRRLHALLIEELSRSGASAVAFDILFAEPSTEPADDQALADAARRAGNVIFGSHISQVIRPDYQQTLRVEPLAMLVDAAETTGMVSIFPDPDGIIRTGVTHIEGEPSLAYAAAETAGRIASPRASGCCDSLFLIDFFGPSATMKTVSYYQVIGKSLPADFFKEKIVLVGHCSDVSADVGGAVDAYPSPFFRFSRKMMYGVEIHANIVETLIARCPLQAVSGPWQVPLFLLLAWAPVFVRKRPVFLTVLTSGIVLGLAGGSIVLFLYADLMMDVVPATAAAFGSGLWVGMREYRITAREKKQLRQAFSIYVAPAVVNEVLRNPDLLRLGGQKKELTVLFSDIRGFTSLSEKLDPERLVLLLNHYLSRMTDTVFNHNGTLDKYMGDAVMAIFGAPLPSDTHAISACQAALDMLSALDAAEAEWKSMGFPPFRIGIGINTGSMVVGNMGSDRRFDYTVMGDEVNLASRLEGLNKAYGTSAIISEATRCAIDDRFVCREIDRVRVKGKTKPIMIYELIAMGETPAAWTRVLSGFSTGLSAYRNRLWADAREAFEAVLTEKPDDGPSRVFLGRCDLLEKESLPSDWDGVWTMLSK